MLWIIIAGEIIFTSFVAWGIMHEDKFISFENKIGKKVKKWIEKKR